MSRTCEICERGTTTKVSRSHSNIGTIKKVGINLQTRKLGGKRTKICTKCLKTMAKVAKK